MFELAPEYEECVLLQTWTEIPTVNVRNGMRLKWELKRFLYIHVFFRRPPLLCSVFWPLNVRLSQPTGAPFPM